MRGLDFLWEIFCLKFSVQGYNDNDDGIYIYYDEVAMSTMTMTTMMEIMIRVRMTTF